MKCIIIEDQVPAQRILKRYIKQTVRLNLYGTFNNASEAQSFLKQNPDVSVLFVDINLPKISGMDFVRSLPRNYHVIFTTAFSEYAVESYSLHAVDYLLKPFSFERFEQSVKRLQDQSDFNLDNSRFINIKSGIDVHRIEMDRILYIHSDLDYTEVVTTDDKHLSSERLWKWQEKLNNHQFFRIHRSYIVQLKHITKHNKQVLVVNNKHELPIGRKYKNELLRILRKRLE